jgi:hypothetical protein
MMMFPPRSDRTDVSWIGSNLRRYDDQEVMSR